MGGGGNKIDGNDGQRRKTKGQNPPKIDEANHSRGADDVNAEECEKLALHEEEWRKEKEKAKTHANFDTHGDANRVPGVQKPPV